jgi:hypothetical protein
LIVRMQISRQLSDQPNCSVSTTRTTIHYSMKTTTDCLKQTTTMKNSGLTIQS